MGAINYYTSDYITLGIKPYEPEDLLNDSDFMQFIKEEWKIDIDKPYEKNYELRDAIRDEINELYSCDLENVNTEIEKYSFWYYHVTVKPGYYEGFTIDIENNFPCFYDDYIAKKEANKELTQLKQFLVACAGFGLVSCSPGWCTGYKDYSGTIADINRAIKEAREEIKHIPTWLQYKRGEK